MLISMLCRRGLLVAAWCQVVVGSTYVAGEDATLPEPIKGALSRYADATTMSMKWTQQYHLGDLARDRLRADKIQYLAPPRNHYLVWQRGYMYHRTAIGTDTNEFAFDGRIVAGGSTDGDQDRVLRKDPANDLDANADYFGVDDLQPFGIQYPQGAAQLLDRKPLQSFVLVQLEHGARIKSVDKVQIDDRSVQRISLLVTNPRWRILQNLDLAKTEAELHMSAESDAWIQEHLAVLRRAKETMSPELMYVLYLDPEIDYAVRRWQDLTIEGRLRMQADCTQHEKIPGHGIWLARKCQIDYFTFDEDYSGEIFDKPFLTSVVEVSDFDTNAVPDELFTLNYNVPGAKITDATLPESKLGKGAVSYTIPVDLNDLDRTVERARQLTRVQSEGRHNPLTSVFIVGNAIVVAGLLAYLVIRHRTKAAKS